MGEVLVTSIPGIATGRVSLPNFLKWLAAGSSIDLEAEQVRWMQEWEVHCKECQRQQFRRRGLLVLALIAEPFQREWVEVLLDVTWSAWRELIATLQRQT